MTIFAFVMTNILHSSSTETHDKGRAKFYARRGIHDVMFNILFSGDRQLGMSYSDAPDQIVEES